MLDSAVSLVFISSGIPAKNQNQLSVTRIWATPLSENPEDWWVFIIVQVSEASNEFMADHIFTATIQDQIHVLERDLSYLSIHQGEYAFFARFTDLEPGLYQITLRWDDSTQTKMWPAERIQLGKTSEFNNLMALLPPVFLLSFILIFVLFPGKSNKTPLTNQLEHPEEVHADS